MNNTIPPLAHSNRDFLSQIGELPEMKWTIFGRLELSLGANSLPFAQKVKFTKAIAQGDSTLIAKNHNAGMIQLKDTVIVWRLFYGPWEDCRKPINDKEYSSVYRVLKVSTLAECLKPSLDFNRELENIKEDPEEIMLLSFPVTKIVGSSISVEHNGMIWNIYQSEARFLSEFPSDYHKADHPVFKDWAIKPDVNNSDYFVVSVTGDDINQIGGNYFHNPFPVGTEKIILQAHRKARLDNYPIEDFTSWYTIGAANKMLPRNVYSIAHPMFKGNGEELAKEKARTSSVTLWVGETFEEALFKHTYTFLPSDPDWVPGDPDNIIKRYLGT